MSASRTEITRRSVARRVVLGSLWLGVGGLTAALLVRRYIDATADTGLDLESFYLPAARAVAAGDSPYDTEGYVYTPLIAFLLAPFTNTPWIADAWKALLLAVAVIACILGVLASTPRGSTVHRAVVLGVAVVSVLYSWPMAHDLWYGQPNAFVLLAMTAAMLAHTRDRRGLAGFALGVGVLVKTWPGGLLLWLSRAPLRFRAREWQGVGLAALIGLALILTVDGPRALRDLARVTFRYSDQDLVAYSVWGAADFLFSDQDHSVPIMVSPVLGGAVAWTLALVLLGLLALLLRRPGDPVVALPNLMFLLILLIPVAHGGYMVLAAPVLWWWVAYALRDPRRLTAWLPATVLGIWWVVSMRVARSGVEGTSAQAQYILILAVTLAAVTTSIVCASRLGPRAEFAQMARRPRAEATQGHGG